jgi:hypothetical protein
MSKNNIGNYDACLFIMNWVATIQTHFPEYAGRGDPYGHRRAGLVGLLLDGFEGGFSAFRARWKYGSRGDTLVVQSLLGIPARVLQVSSGRRVPSAEEPGGFIVRFISALEARAVRKDAQPAVAMLEDILDDALPRHGPEIMARLAGGQGREKEGAEILARLRRAGVRFRDEARFMALVAGQGVPADAARPRPAGLPCSRYGLRR